MLHLILVAAFVSAAQSQLAVGVEDCDSSQLDVCVERLPLVKKFGIPLNQLELENHCRAYHVGMGCMDTWVARCMPGDTQRAVGQQTAGARSLMFLMCNSSLFQKEYLREKACWPAVSSELSRCIERLHADVLGVAQRAPHDANAQLCCVRDEFDRCVWGGARARCSVSAARLLRRMTRVLAADVASCTDDVVCAAATHTVRLLTVVAVSVVYWMQ